MSERAKVLTTGAGVGSRRSGAARTGLPRSLQSQLSDAPRIDRTRALAAHRHSKFVALMKGLLPSLVVGLIVVFIFYSRGGFTPALPDDFVFDPGQIDVAGEGVKMVNPKLSGIDDKNQRFEVAADSAIQDRTNPGMVTLDQIHAEMQLAEGGWVRVDAKGGAFDSDSSILTLEHEIEVTMSSGYVAHLNGASVNFQKGTLVTVNPVQVVMNAGIITGNAMEILDKGKLVRFTNRASMTINGNPTETKVQ